MSLFFVKSHKKISNAINSYLINNKINTKDHKVIFSSFMDYCNKTKRYSTIEKEHYIHCNFRKFKEYCKTFIRRKETINRLFPEKNNRN